MPVKRRVGKQRPQVPREYWRLLNDEPLGDDDNPFRSRGRPYVILGALYSRRVGPALLYVNAEDLADVRQTKWDPLLRPAPLRDGRWPVDEWAPLEGRAVNAGLQFRF